jgi:hypothetical protein
MTEKIYPIEIRLSGKCSEYSASYQTKEEYLAQWHEVLKKAYRRATVRCLCPGNGSKRISIRYISAQDRYYLARYPKTAHEHSEDCVYHSHSSFSGQSWSMRKEAVEKLPDGTLKIKLPVGVKKRSIEEIKRDVQRQGTYTGSASTRTSKPATELQRLLHILWEESHLNTWYPSMEGKRNHSRVSYWIRQAANNIRVGYQRLDSILCVSALEGSPDEAKNQATVAFCRKKKYRLIVIALLARYNGCTPGQCGHVPVRGFAEIPVLRIPSGLWAETEKKYPFEVSYWKEGLRVVAIIQTEPPEKGVAEVVDMALMAVSEQWIPVQSDSDRQEERRLRAEGQSFKKTPSGFSIIEKSKETRKGIAKW